MLQELKPRIALLCGRCVNTALQVLLSLDRSFAKDGSEVTYPKQELPDAVKWGKDKWSPDYRDKTESTVMIQALHHAKLPALLTLLFRGYIKMAAQGRYTDALALIKKKIHFLLFAGRVCNRRCEDACTRGTIDEAVAIDEVKRFIAQKDLDAETRYIPEKIIPSNRGEFNNKIATSPFSRC